MMDQRKFEFQHKIVITLSSPSLVLAAAVILATLLVRGELGISGSDDSFSERKLHGLSPIRGEYAITSVRRNACWSARLKIIIYESLLSKETVIGRHQVVTKRP